MGKMTCIQQGCWNWCRFLSFCWRDGGSHTQRACGRVWACCHLEDSCKNEESASYWGFCSYSSYWEGQSRSFELSRVSWWHTVTWANVDAGFHNWPEIGNLFKWIFHIVSALWSNSYFFFPILLGYQLLTCNLNHVKVYLQRYNLSKTDKRPLCNQGMQWIWCQYL